MAEPKWKKLQWKIEYLGPKGSLKRLKAGEAVNLGAKTYFAVRGRLPKELPLLYVVRVGAESQILSISLLAIAGELDATPGREVRLPQPGTFLFNATKGAVSVLAFERAVSREELARLIGAREPPPDPTTREST